MNAPKLDEQIACVSRVIAMREKVYPRLVETGKMKKPVADHEIACMKAALGTLMAAWAPENRHHKESVMSEVDEIAATREPRPITRAVLEEFFVWTRSAPMFLSSPEGRQFGEELREAFTLVYETLERRDG
jgi:hypothetical protein